MTFPNRQDLSSIEECAIWYSQQGLAIFQLAAKSKKPQKGSHGFKEATKDPDQIRSLWTKNPDGNVAAATGAASDVFVIDLDGDIGRQSLVDLESSLGHLPPTVTVLTPGKIEDGKHTGQGRHLYFRLPSGISLNSRTGIAEKIDTRGEGGYVVLPPSTHPDGGTYQFEPNKVPGQIEIAELPVPWIEFFADKKPQKTSASPLEIPVAVPENAIQQNIDSIANPNDQLLKRVVAYLGTCDGAVQGKNGHGTLLTVATALEHGYCLEPSVSESIAWQYYNPKCLPPWTDAERYDFARKFTEAHDKPPNKPRGWLLSGTDSETPYLSPVGQTETPTLTPIGQIDPTTGKVVLDVNRTKPTAEAFIRKHYTVDGFQTIRYLDETFFGWKENAYRIVGERHLRKQMYEFLDDAVLQTVLKDKTVNGQFPAKKTHVDNAIDALKSVASMESGLPIPRWLGNDPAPISDPSMILFGKTRNLDISTMKVFDPSPKYFNYNSLDFDLDMSKSQCPCWDEFMSSLFGEDIESKTTLMQYIGYLLTPITKIQKAMLIIGPPRSGKGTIGRIIPKLVGESNVAAPTTDGLAKPFGLQQLIGKTVAIISDARFGGQNHTLTERILTITGEDTLTFDRKYKEASTTRFATRFLVLSNELPRLTDSSGALDSRFIILKLTKSFLGKEDLDLEKKLMAELPGILIQAVTALQDLLKQGYFKQPQSANDDVQLLKNLTSPIAHFVQERCEVGDACWWTPTDELFTAWQIWSKAEGYQTGGTKATFCRNLMAAMPELAKKRSSDSGRPWGYSGIRLIPTSLPSYYENRPNQ